MNVPNSLDGSLAKMADERVLEVAGVKRVSMGVVSRSQLRFLGYKLRRDCLENDLLLGSVDRRHGRRRQRMKYSTSWIKQKKNYVYYLQYIEKHDHSMVNNNTNIR